MLAEIANFQLQKRDLGIVSILSEYVIWEGRYPVAKNVEGINRSHNLYLEFATEKIDDIIKGCTVIKVH